MVRPQVSPVNGRKGSGRRLRRVALLALGLWLIAGRPVPGFVVPGSGLAAERTAAGLVENGRTSPVGSMQAEPQEADGHESSGEVAGAMQQAGSGQEEAHAEDSSGHYHPGAYGDSTESGDGTPVKQLFDRFLKEKVIGATPDKIYAMEPMHGEVDAYTGATVTPNNAVSMLKGLLGYHSKRYM